MNKFLNCTIILVLLAACFIGLYKMSQRNKVEPAFFPQYKSTNRSVSYSNNSGISGFPQPTIKPVNVSIKQYHAKAVVHQRNYELRQQTSTYSSAQGLTLSSSATTHSYGDGSTVPFNSTSTTYQTSTYNPTDFYNSVYNFQIQSNLSRQIAYNNSRYTEPTRYATSSQTTYRALGDMLSLTIGYEDEFAATPGGSIGLIDNGDGTYSYNSFWESNFKAYVQSTLGISSGSPLYADIESHVFNWKYYPVTTSPSVPDLPPGDPLPLGDGTWIFLLFVFAYVSIIAIKLKKVKQQNQHS